MIQSQYTGVPKIITRSDYPNMYTEEEMEIMDEIENYQLTEEQQEAARDIKLKEEEEKVAIQRLNDEKEVTEEKKKEKIDNFKLLKAKYEKYKEQEKKDNTRYKSNANLDKITINLSININDSIIEEKNNNIDDIDEMSSSINENENNHQYLITRLKENNIPKHFFKKIA